MSYSFFASMWRLKYIERWALMRNSRQENLSEHSLEVAMISHALVSLGNLRYGRNADADKVAVIALYHDATEIITGDMPTPVKYHSEELREAYKAIEKEAESRLLSHLPEDLKSIYSPIFSYEGVEKADYLKMVVKAADRLSAYIKCIEEERSGNTEFRSAKESIWQDLEERVDTLPELRDFIESFLPAFGKTLDELEIGA